MIDKKKLKKCQKLFFKSFNEIKKKINNDENEKLNNLILLWLNINKIKSVNDLYIIENNQIFLNKFLNKQEKCPKYIKYVTEFQKYKTSYNIEIFLEDFKKYNTIYF